MITMAAGGRWASLDHLHPIAARTAERWRQNSRRDGALFAKKTVRKPKVYYLNTESRAFQNSTTTWPINIWNPELDAPTIDEIPYYNREIIMGFRTLSCIYGSVPIRWSLMPWLQ
jgi:hypothetical protein